MMHKVDVHNRSALNGKGQVALYDVWRASKRERRAHYADKRDMDPVRFWSAVPSLVLLERSAGKVVTRLCSEPLKAIFGLTTPDVDVARALDLDDQTINECFTRPQAQRLNWETKSLDGQRVVRVDGLMTPWRDTSLNEHRALVLGVLIVQLKTRYPSTGSAVREYGERSPLDVG